MRSKLSVHLCKTWKRSTQYHLIYIQVEAASQFSIYYGVTNVTTALKGEADTVKSFLLYGIRDG
jgi:hypothetical protein